MSIEELKNKVISEIRNAKSVEEIRGVVNEADGKLLISNLDFLTKSRFWNIVHNVLKLELREQNDTSTHNLVKQALEIINQKINS